MGACATINENLFHVYLGSNLIENCSNVVFIMVYNLIYKIQNYQRYGVCGLANEGVEKSSS